MKRLFTIMLAILALNVFTGCESLTSASKTSAYDTKIALIEKQFEDKRSKEIETIKITQLQKDTAIQKNLEQAASLAFSIYTINGLKPNPNRYDILIDLRSKELVSRLPAVPSAQLIVLNEQLRIDLDESKTSFEQLQARYSQAQIKATEDRQAILLIQETLTQNQAALDLIEKQHKNDIIDLQHEQHKVDTISINEANAKLELAQNKQAIIAWLVKTFLFIGIVSGIAAYFFKSIILAAVSALSIGASVFIAYVQPWVIIVSGVVIIALIAFVIGKKFIDEKKLKIAQSTLSSNLIGAIEDYKTKIGKEVFSSTLGEHLKEWSKEDPTTFNNHVESKLKELNLI